MPLSGLIAASVAGPWFMQRHRRYPLQRGLVIKSLIVIQPDAQAGVLQEYFFERGSKCLEKVSPGSRIMRMA